MGWLGLLRPMPTHLTADAWWLFGTREKWGHEDMSAYSVFNEGQARLLGDRSAAQLDSELLCFFRTKPKLTFACFVVYRYAEFSHKHKHINRMGFGS
jgi:hypothetical protein